MVGMSQTMKPLSATKTGKTPAMRDPQTGRFLPGHQKIGGRPKGSPDGIVNLRKQLGDGADILVNSGLLIERITQTLLRAKTTAEKDEALGKLLRLFTPYTVKLPSPDPKAAQGEFVTGTDSTPDEIVGAMDATIPDAPAPSAEEISDGL